MDKFARFSATEYPAVELRRIPDIRINPNTKFHIRPDTGLYENAAFYECESLYYYFLTDARLGFGTGSGRSYFVMSYFDRMQNP